MHVRSLLACSSLCLRSWLALPVHTQSLRPQTPSAEAANTSELRQALHPRVQTLNFSYSTSSSPAT
jgi:hypothetical protein